MAPGGRTGEVQHSHTTRSLTRVTPAPESVRLGLRANWQQFTLLVVINAFVGGMVGLERAVLPLLAEQDFLITSRTALLSFIVTFGVTKRWRTCPPGDERSDRP